MTEEFHRVSAKGFAFLARGDETLWDRLLGATVEHQAHGVGRISAIEYRRNYTPLITLDFGGVRKQWPPKSFETGKVHLLVDSSLAPLVEAAEVERDAEERASIEAKRLEDERREAALIEAVRWRSLSPEERRQEQMVNLEKRHKRFLEELGVGFKGVRPASRSRFHRVSRCYSCHEELDNSVDVECMACNWILCMCGACGCGYRP